MTARMQLKQEPIDLICAESDLYRELLSFDGKHILELGCGTASITRAIAREGEGRRITAVDVDEYQIQKHSAAADLPNVTFELGGAEEIPADDEAFDIVLMFKSLHHVPVDRMGRSLREIHRVLKSGGQAYFSEPLFQGDFNEVLRLFHDEEVVRREAFLALQEAVQAGLFCLVDERFFCQPRVFVDFDQFDAEVIRATHTNHGLSEEAYAAVKARFMPHVREGGASFLCPMRLDVLRKLSAK